MSLRVDADSSFGTIKSLVSDITDAFSRPSSQAFVRAKVAPPVANDSVCNDEEITEDFPDDNDDDTFVEPQRGLIYLSIYSHSGKLGAACYEFETKFVHLLEDVVETPDLAFPMFQNLIRQVRPRTVIASLRQEYRFMYQLKRYCFHTGEVGSESSTNDLTLNNDEEKPKLVYVPVKAFDLESCRQTISDTLAGNKENCLGSNEKLLHARFSINFDAQCMIRAFGVLIKHLSLSRFVSSAELSERGTIRSSTDDKSDFFILGIRKLSLYKMVLIDYTTLNSLQIFQQQLHPSVYKYGKGGVAEGLSIFSICNRCCSGPGAAELRRWILRPTADKTILDRRLDAVEYFTKENNVGLVSAMRKTLRSISGLSRLLIRMQQMQTSINDWCTLYKTVYSCVHMSELLQVRENKPTLLKDLSKRIDGSVRHIGSLLGKLVDFDETRKARRFSVLRGVDKELDRKKDLYQALPDLLTEYVMVEIQNLEFTPSECSLVYLPLIGYLLTIPKTVETELANFEKPGLDFIFCAEGLIYYKNATCRRLDSEVGDVKYMIVDRETSIMLTFQEIILENAYSLVDAVQACAEIDCLISFATAAQEFNWVKPTIVEDGQIDIVNGRHPLVEMCKTSVVANPTVSGGQCKAKMHLITGPNASGKSIYLKQIGILVYLTHVGSFVPAEKATIGLVDRIFTRVHTIDSVLDGMSTFAHDLRQISVAVADAGVRSLVIIDEFGKGALTEVGLSLLVACLENWLNKASECPHVFVSTHFYAVLSMLPKSDLLRYETMETVRQGTEFIFLHQLVEGYIDDSYAIYVAKQLNLRQDIVQRSDHICSCLKTGEKIMLPGQSEKEREAELKETLSVVNEFLELDLDNCDPLEFLSKFNVETTELVESFRTPECSSISSSHNENFVEKEQTEEQHHSKSLSQEEAFSQISNGFLSSSPIVFTF